MCPLCWLVLLPPQLPGVTGDLPSWGQVTGPPLTAAPGHHRCRGTFNPLAELTLTLFDGNRGCEPGANRLALCAGSAGIRGSLRPPECDRHSHGLQSGCTPLPCKGKETLSPV